MRDSTAGTKTKSHIPLAETSRSTTKKLGDITYMRLFTDLTAWEHHTREEERPSYCLCCFILRRNTKISGKKRAESLESQGGVVEKSAAHGRYQLWLSLQSGSVSTRKTALELLRGGKMCYYRRLHFVSCNHQYWIEDSIMRYCSAAAPNTSNNGPNECTSLTPPSSPASVNKCQRSSTSIPSRPRDDEFKILTQPSSSPPALQQPVTPIRKASNRPQKLPCTKRLSHPCSTYRISTICPRCAASRAEQKVRFASLRDGLATVRMKLDRLASREAAKARARDADADADKDVEAQVEINLEDELGRLGARIGEEEESETAETVTGG